MLLSKVDEKGSVKGKDISTVYRIVIAQLLATFLATIISFLLQDWVTAYSAMLGGLSCALPSGFMAYRFGSRAVASVGMALGHLVRGELGKYLLTMAMFVIIFKTVTPLAAGYFLQRLD